MKSLETKVLFYSLITLFLLLQGCQSADDTAKSKDIVQPTTSVGAESKLMKGAKQPASQQSQTTPKKIKTSLGELEIMEVQEADRFPPGCMNPPSPGCRPSKDGYKVLVVWLNSEDNVNLGIKLYDASKEVYVTDGEGERTNQFSGGMMEEKLFVAFTPKEDSQNFKLHWPNNEAIELSSGNK